MRYNSMVNGVFFNEVICERRTDSKRVGQR
jgi:hypothetical protein